MAACARNSGARRLLPISSSHWAAVILPMGVGVKLEALLIEDVQPAEFLECRADQPFRGLHGREIGADAGRGMSGAAG